MGGLKSEVNSRFSGWELRVDGLGGLKSEILHLTEPEWRLMAKTTPQRAPEVQAAWRELHPYELPAIWTVAAHPSSTPNAVSG